MAVPTGPLQIILTFLCLVNILKVRENVIDPLTPVHQVSHFMSSISFCAETNRNLRQKLNSPQKKPAVKITVMLAIILSGDIQVLSIRVVHVKNQ